MVLALSGSIFFCPRTRVDFFLREERCVADAAWVVFADFVLPGDFDEFDVFEDGVVVVGFAVAGCPCPAAPLEACRALAAGMRTHMPSSAQATPNGVLRVPSNVWIVNVNP